MAGSTQTSLSFPSRHRHCALELYFELGLNFVLREQNKHSVQKRPCFKELACATVSCPISLGTGQLPVTPPLCS